MWKTMYERYIIWLYICPWELPIKIMIENTIQAKEILINWRCGRWIRQSWAYIRYKDYLMYYNPDWLVFWLDYNRKILDNHIFWPFILFGCEWKWVFKDSDLNELQILELKEEFWQSSLDKVKDFLHSEEWLVYGN